MHRAALGLVVATIVAFSWSSLAQSKPHASPAQPPTAIDGGLGPCSLELTVNTADGQPVTGASVKVHIAYGFGGFHKLDLEAGANAEGQVKFTGLPSRVRRPPLEFDATKGELAGTATYDPAAECHAKREITLGKKSPSPE